MPDLDAPRLHSSKPGKYVIAFLAKHMVLDCPKYNLKNLTDKRDGALALAVPSVSSIRCR